jgi:hypothetical protein
MFNGLHSENPEKGISLIKIITLKIVAEAMLFGNSFAVLGVEVDSLFEVAQNNGGDNTS